jgi:hypothetical protein
VGRDATKLIEWRQFGLDAAKRGEMQRDWRLPGALLGAGAMVALAVFLRPVAGPHEIRLSEHEVIRVDATTGRSQACTTLERRERCLTLSGQGGRFLPHIREDMRELGVRDVVRAQLRGE